MINHNSVAEYHAAVVRFMKLLQKCLSLAVLILGTEIASGQAFVNLGFENTTLTPYLVNVFSGFYTTNATLPGWFWSPQATYGYGDPTTEVMLNNFTLEAPAVSLHTSNDIFPAIRGKYSILLQGGGSFVSSSSAASIGQTGHIASAFASLTYWGDALQVSFNGQPLSFVAISNAPNFTVWGADISAIAGQTGELLFTAPWQTTGMLDNIQFSTSPIPEPASLTMFICGTFLICYRVSKLGCRFEKRQ